MDKPSQVSAGVAAVRIEAVIAMTPWLITACQASSPNKLTMLTVPNFCPYQFITENSDRGDLLEGFDIDLAEAIAQELGYTLTIKQQQHFNQLFSDLSQDKADFAMAAITPTSDRQQLLTFSDIYYTQQMAIVSHRENIFPSLDTLVSHQVGVIEGSYHALALERYPLIKPIAFNTSRELIAAVKRQYVDAGILDQVIAPKYVSPASRLQWTPGPPSTEIAGVAIAFPPQSPLVDSFNEALAILKDNGTVTRLVHRWFDTHRCTTDEEN